MVYAGVQKNVGPAGVCIAIIREDLIGNACEDTTSMLDWKVHSDAPEKLYNTPCCWGIYMCGLNIAYMLEKGFDKVVEEAGLKTGMLYEYIDSSDGYYSNPVDPRFRSRVNVPFRVKKDADLEKKFLEGCKEVGLIELKGHRTVGGIRASIYNAMPIEGVQALIDYMKTFKEENP